MTKKNPSLIKKSAASFRGKAGPVIAATLAFWIMSMVGLAPALISPLFLVVTVPLILAPTLYLFIASIGGISQEKDFELNGKTGWSLFFFYFSRPMHGCFRLMTQLFKAICAYFLAMTASTFVLSTFGDAFWPNFTNTINELSSLLSSGSSSDAYTFIANNQTLMQFSAICNAIAFFFAFVFFCHGALASGMNVYLRSSVRMGRNVNALYRGTIAQNRGEFYSTYYSFAWPLIPLAIIGYWGGAIAGLFTSSAIIFSMAFGMAGAFTLCSFYLPFYAASTGYFFNRFEKRFVDFTIASAESSLYSIKESGQMSQEEIAQLEKQLEDFKAQHKKKEEGDKDQKEDGGE